jgi:hypothetical protein
LLSYLQRERTTPFHNRLTVMPSPLPSSATSSLLSSSGRELLLDLKRSSAQSSSSNAATGAGGLPVLPPYNAKLVQACFQDLNACIQELDLQVRALSRSEGLRQPRQHRDNPDDDDDAGGGKPSMAARPSILLLNASIQRNKRCLLAYHYHRMNILRDIQRLQPSGGDAAAQDGAASCSAGGGGDDDCGAVGGSGISTNAREVAFAQDYAALRSAYSTEVFDLGLLPPASHMLQVRVVRDAGQVVLPDSGRAVTLSRGACLFVDRADVQDLLQRGVVRIYDGEEVDF